MLAQVDDDFAWLEKNIFSQNRVVFPASDFSAAKWRWAVGVALSRGFFVDGCSRIAPLIDFANHDPARPEVGSGGSGALASGWAAVTGQGKDAGKEVRIVANRNYQAKFVRTDIGSC